MQNKKNIPAWAVLTLITIAAALLLSGTYELTKGTIERQEKEKAELVRKSMIPGASSFEKLETPPELKSLYIGEDENGQPLGYVSTAAVMGFGGEIEVTIGLDQSGKLTGVFVGGSSFSETAGLGARAKEPFFTEQFKGLTPPVVLNEDVDAITSATITSNAVVRGVNIAAEGTGQKSDNSQAVKAGRLAEYQFYGQAQGFMGPVYVAVTLDGEGTITNIQIGNELFKESDGYGKNAQQPDFFNQFIGKKSSVSLNQNIDGISGATVTSKAVVDAVNAALNFAENMQPPEITP